MRILVTVNPAAGELHDDLARLPPRHRAERLRMLAHAALVGAPASNPATGHTGNEIDTQTTSPTGIPLQDDSPGVIRKNMEFLDDDID